VDISWTRGELLVQRKTRAADGEGRAASGSLCVVSNEALHALETQFYTQGKAAEPPSLAFLNLATPRTTSDVLPFAWRLQRTHDYTPVLTSLVVIGGELVRGETQGSDEVKALPTPFLKDPVRWVDGQSRYDSTPFRRHARDDWDVVDGVLRTAFDIEHLVGPFRISTKRSGDFGLSCLNCGWKSHARRSSTVNLAWLGGDVVRHNCQRR
jgi:hypothetical protein